MKRLLIILLLGMYGCREDVTCIECCKDERLVVQCEDEVSNWHAQTLLNYWEQQNFTCKVTTEDHSTVSGW